jgi:hypothetical protein
MERERLACERNKEEAKALAPRFDRSRSSDDKSRPRIEFAAGAASPSFRRDYQSVSVVRTDPIFIFLALPLEAAINVPVVVVGVVPSVV